ncbi:MAG TPA: HAMP domain-containing sensor histidine kinase [Burkholderiales bacterium]
MPALSETQETAGLRSIVREVTPLSMWGGDKLVYQSIIVLAVAALPLVALANWLAHGTPWGSQLTVAGALSAGALVCYGLSRRGLQDTAAALLIGVIWSSATIFAFATEFGLHSSVIYLYLPCMLYTVLFFGVTAATFELALTVGCLLLMYWAEEHGTIGGLRAFTAHSSNLNFLIGVIVTCVGTLIVGVVYHRRVAREAGRVVAEAEQRRLAMEQAQLAQSQLGIAHAQLQALNGDLAVRGRAREEEMARLRRDIDLFHDVVSKDFPASLKALRTALAAPGADTGTQLQREIGRMEAVTGALEELGRHNLPQLKRAPIDLSLVAQEVIRNLRAEQDWARVRFDVDPHLQAEGDRHLVAALLRHLIRRAARACQAEREPRVHVGGGSHEGQAVFFVSDNGAGMDAAQREKLFRPFQRSQAEEHTVDIGIVSARRIVERHGGELALESSPDRGTTFHFSLPPA